MVKYCIHLTLHESRLDFEPLGKARQGTLFNPIQLPSAIHSHTPHRYYFTLPLPGVPHHPSPTPSFIPHFTPRSNHPAPASAFCVCIFFAVGVRQASLDHAHRHPSLDVGREQSVLVGPSRYLQLLVSRRIIFTPASVHSFHMSSYLCLQHPLSVIHCGGTSSTLYLVPVFRLLSRAPYLGLAALGLRASDLRLLLTLNPFLPPSSLSSSATPIRLLA